MGAGAGCFMHAETTYQIHQNDMRQEEKGNIGWGLWQSVIYRSDIGRSALALTCTLRAGGIMDGIRLQSESILVFHLLRTHTPATPSSGKDGLCSVARE